MPDNVSDSDVPVATLVIAGDDRKALGRRSDVDAVVFDLTDARDKNAARSEVTDALSAEVWRAAQRFVRVNDWTTQWTYRDVIEVVEGAGEQTAALVLPRVHSAHDVVALDLLLTQIETTMRLDVGCVRVIAQLDDARGVQAASTLAAASARVCALATTSTEFTSAVVLAARAADLPAFAFAADASAVAQARDDGFDGVGVDDPALVAVAVKAWSR